MMKMNSAVWSLTVRTYGFSSWNMVSKCHHIVSKRDAHFGHQIIQINWIWSATPLKALWILNNCTRSWRTQTSAVLWLNCCFCPHQRDVSRLSVLKLNVCSSQCLKRPPSSVIMFRFFSPLQLSDDLGCGKAAPTQMQFWKYYITPPFHCKKVTKTFPMNALE